MNEQIQYNTCARRKNKVVKTAVRVCIITNNIKPSRQLNNNLARCIDTVYLAAFGCSTGTNINN